MAGEVVGDRSSGALWVTEEYLDFIPSAWEFMQKGEMLYLITLFVVLDWPESSFGFFRNILRKNPNTLFGQPSNTAVFQHLCICISILMKS